MKLAISNIGWNQPEEERVLDLMRRHGFQGLEVAPSKVWSSPEHALEDEVRSYREQMREKGFSIVGIQSALFGHPELKVFDATSEATLAYLDKMVQICSWLGGKVLVFGSPKNRQKGDLSDDEMRERSHAFFKALGDMAQRHDVIIGMEPNAADYGADFLTHADATLQFVHDLQHPAVRIHLDTGVMQLNGEDVTQVLNNAAPMLCHFHVSEPFLKPFVLSDFHRHAAQALKQLDYDGWVSVEMVRPDSPLEELERVLQQVKEVYG
jgi:D-psicose/D-tagatose/L-ribulose 3-epimerase